VRIELRRGVFVGGGGVPHTAQAPI